VRVICKVEKDFVLGTSGHAGIRVKCSAKALNAIVDLRENVIWGDMRAREEESVTPKRHRKVYALLGK